MTTIEEVVPPDESFMGIDWGMQTTIIIMNKEGDILNAVKVESRGEEDFDEVEVIKEMILRYNCVSVVCDIGYGLSSSERITTRVWRACEILLLRFATNDSI